MSCMFTKPEVSAEIPPKVFHDERNQHGDWYGADRSETDSNSVIWKPHSQTRKYQKEHKGNHSIGKRVSTGLCIMARHLLLDSIHQFDMDICDRFLYFLVKT